MPARILWLLLLLPLTAAQAPAEDGGGQEPSDALGEALPELPERCAPPCGYILPVLEIVVEDKLACGGGQLIFADEPPEDCYEVLAPGESRTIPALLQWKWEMSEEGTYPKEAGTDILITFSGTGSNPAWIDVEVTGEGMVDGAFVIDDAALVDPENMRTIDRDGQPTLWFWYERPIDITFTRTGGPDADGLQRLEDREGVAPFFLKGSSSESGPRFWQSFGIEEFRFNSCTDAAIAAGVPACVAYREAVVDEDAPGLPFLALVAVLGLFMRRGPIAR